MALDDLYRKPGHLIRRAQQISVALFMDECGALDLTPVQYAALSAIKDQPGIDATRLAGRVAFDRPTIGGVLDRLEAKGWITRRGAPEDRRIKVLHLTRAGETLLQDVQPAVGRVQQRILEPLDPQEREQLVGLLAKLVDLNNDVSRAPRLTTLLPPMPLQAMS